MSMEDFRPQALDEIVGQTAAVARLHRLADGILSGKIVPPNLLMHGPPGVGKTTAARAFARLVLGEDYENSFHQLTSADERGVNRIRNEIVPAALRPPSRTAPFRIFFFDEADRLVPKAQAALQPAMEGESGSTVFILACNNVRLLSKPIQSRCTVLEFAPLSTGEMRRLVFEVAYRNRLEVDDATLDGMVAEAEGIPREAVKLLIERHAGQPVGLPEAMPTDPLDG
ncbi:MAG: AAA family ATPase [Thermoplasmata archaeon]|nr:AAA family ATPase [Thermoplasmata archaeon]